MEYGCRDFGFYDVILGGVVLVIGWLCFEFGSVKCLFYCEEFFLGLLFWSGGRIVCSRG